MAGMQGEGSESGVDDPYADGVVWFSEAVAAGIRDGGGEARFARTDVGDEASVEAMVSRAVSEWGRIDCAFNNAGVTEIVPAEAETEESFRWVMDVNLNGLFLCCQRFGRVMLEAGQGSIINVSSIAGKRATMLGGVAYNASKFAVRGFTEALMVDFRVNAPHLTASVVMPGHIGTHIARNSMLEFGLDPKDLRDDQVAEMRRIYHVNRLDFMSATVALLGVCAIDLLPGLLLAALLAAGWIAVGLVIFAQWDPFRAALGAFLFGALRRGILDLQGPATLLRLLRNQPAPRQNKIYM